jgi:hypothetical protein
LIAAACDARLLDARLLGARLLGVGLATSVAGGTIAAGRETRASACTATVESVATTAASTTDEAPANIHIIRGVFKLVLRDFRFITICLFY